MSILDETLSTGEINVGSSNPSSSLLSSSENISTDNLDTNTSEELDSQQEESVEILATDNMELAEISLSGDAGVSHTELEGQINTIGGGIDTVVVGTTPYTVQHPGDNYVTIPDYPTREVLGITELEDDVEALTERVDALAGDAGEHDLPIYIENGEAREIDALDVEGYVIGRRGVAAHGIADLTEGGGGSGGGGGTVTGAKIGDGERIDPDDDGVLHLPAYPDATELTARVTDIEENLDIMSLPEYDDTVAHTRGESFRVLVGGKWKGYRMKVSQDAGQESWPWDVAECERLNLYTLSQPLRMRQGTIKTICK